MTTCVHVICLRGYLTEQCRTRSNWVIHWGKELLARCTVRVITLFNYFVKPVDDGLVLQEP